MTAESIDESARREALRAKLSTLLGLVNKYDIYDLAADLPGQEMVFLLPEIRRALVENPVDYTRRVLLEILRSMGAEGLPALPEVLRLCTHGQLGSYAVWTAQVLVEALPGDPRQRAAWHAVWAAIHERERWVDEFVRLKAASADVPLPPLARECLAKAFSHGPIEVHNCASWFRTRPECEAAATFLAALSRAGRGVGDNALRELASAWDPAKPTLVAELQRWGPSHAAIVARVILYGSRERGDHRPESDIDVAIVLRDAPTWEVARARWLDARERLHASLRQQIHGLLDLQLLYDAEHTPEVHRGVEAAATVIEVPPPTA